MLKFILFTVFFASNFLLFSQVKLSKITQQDLERITQTLKNPTPNSFERLKQEFPIYAGKGNVQFISVLAKKSAQFNTADLSSLGIEIGAQINSIVSLKVPLDVIPSLFQNSNFSELEIASKIFPHLDKAVKDVHADSVQKGINLPQAYTGKNVYIGVTDWGFDYTHPMFYDTNLVTNRIVAAWDQYKRSGPSPSGFTYGTEYNTTQALLDAKSDTANIYSYAYHGSHVAGIAGGSGAGTAQRGLAFDAQFLFTTFLIDAASVLDAYQWMFEKAQADGKRLVISQSWGLHHIGTLDGTSLLSQAINALRDQGVIFSSSAGNNGDVNFHIKKEFTNDTLKTKIDFYTYSANENMWGQSISMWGENSKPFGASIQVLNNTSMTPLAESPFYFTNSTPNYVVDTLIIGSDTVFYNISAENNVPQNNKPFMRLRVNNKNTGFRVVLKVTAVDGTVHLWNVTELITDVGNWGMNFSNIGGGFTAGDANYGISEPACSDGTIAVAAYASSYYTPGGTLVGGTIANFSSKGPTVDGRLKPDISAPGVSVNSSVSSYTDNAYSISQTVNFNGRDYPFTKISGTSMSAPVVSGVCALILEANPNLSAEQVKEIIVQTARQDSKTGVIPTEGSLVWGFGKINAYAAVQLALNTVSIPENKKESNLIVYPNPSNDNIQIAGQLSADASVTIYSAEGKLIQKTSLSGKVIDVQFLPQGMYLLHVQDGNSTHILSFVKE